MIDPPPVGESSPAWHFIGSFDRQEEGENPSQRRLIALFAMQAEVNNGGFDQWFHNPSGHLAPDVLMLAEEVGHGSLATLLSDAIGQFPHPFPLDAETRRDCLLALGPNWDDDLSRRFHALEEVERIDGVMDAYVRDRWSEFFNGG